MNNRLKQLRTTLNMTQTDFAVKIGLTRITIARMEAGDRNITERTQADICREFNVNPQWLISGIGKMFPDDDSSTIKAIENIMSGDDEFYKNIIKMVVKLDHDDIKTLKKMAEELLKNKGDE
ncbi:MAG: helix-turn-helix transcriptional regulator [Anaerorhabdus sp.]|uniref:helix-turn-helix transcriptional regulator n=1 Tax=Anaerorhabdus sp. TaxID=1872524 RepID=UPI003A8B4CC2